MLLKRKYVENKLYYVLYKSNLKKIEKLADAWIDIYKKSNLNGYISLLQFISDASGGRFVIPKIMPENEGFRDLIKTLEESYDAHQDPPPITMVLKAPKRKFCSFIESLIQKLMDHGFALDNVLKKDLLSFLKHLSQSRLPSFRYTATLTAMLILEGNIKSYSTLIEPNADRNKRNSSNTEANDVSELGIERPKYSILFLYRNILLKRYRDILPDIRCLCIKTLVTCIKDMKEVFLKDESNLKLLYISVNDVAGSVKICAIEGFTAIYENLNNKTEIKNFADRYAEDFKILAFDKESNVALSALDLLHTLYRLYPYLYEDDELFFDKLYELTHGFHRNLAITAANILSPKYFTENVSCVDQDVCLSEDVLRLLNFVQKFRQKGMHQHMNFVVDAFIETYAAIKCWKAYEELLMDASKFPEDKAYLIELLYCVVHQLTTHQLPIGRSHLSENEFKKRDCDSQENQRELEHFAEIFISYNEIFLELFDEAKDEHLIGYFLKTQIQLVRVESLKEYFTESISEVILNFSRKAVVDFKSGWLCEIGLNASSLFSREKSTALNLIKEIYYQHRFYMEKIKELAIASTDNLFDEKMIADSTIVWNKLAVISSKYDLHNIIRDVFSQLQNDVVLIFEKSFRNAFFESILASLEVCNNLVQWNFLRFRKGSRPNMATLSRQVEAIIKLFFEALKWPERRLFAAVKKSSFLKICDFLVLILKNLNKRKRSMNDSHQLAKDEEKLLTDFTINYVFLDTDDSDLCKRQVLAAYCKLIMYNILKVEEYGPSIFIHVFQPHGDIIKSCMLKVADANPIDFFVTLLNILMETFVELLKQENCSLLELKKFSINLANEFIHHNPLKDREGILRFHILGLKFILENGIMHYLPFLELMEPFLKNLLNQDKLHLLKCVDEIFNSENFFNSDNKTALYFFYRRLQGLNTSLE